MRSIRKTLRLGALRRSHAVFAFAVSAGVVGGCQTNPAPAPEPVSTEPLAVDPAMQLRDWPRTTAEFQTANIKAGPTRFPYAPQTEGEGVGDAAFGAEGPNALLDGVFFVAQAFALPFTFLADPPFTQKTPRGVMYDATYTAMPVLPPDESGAVDAYNLPPEPAADEMSEPVPSTGDESRSPDAAENMPDAAPESPYAAPEATEGVTPAPDAVEPAPEATVPDAAPVLEATEPSPEPSPTPVPDNADPVPLEPLPEPAPLGPPPERLPEESAPEVVGEEPAPEAAPEEPAPDLNK